MMKPPIPKNETERLNFLRQLGILDTPAEERFDRITRLALFVFDVPISTITLIDENREWHKSCQGLTLTESPREITFCAHAINAETILEIPDTAKDPRFADNPMVTGYPYIKYYAGVPLKFKNNMVIGTLCIKDTKPRNKLSEEQFSALLALGVWTKAEIQLTTLLKNLTLEQKQKFVLSDP